MRLSRLVVTARDDDLYAVLGVSSSATQSEIQAAYKRLARELHPDVNRAADAEDQFKRLAEAYDVLRDERKRARYDAFGKRRRRPHRDDGIRFEDVRVGDDDLRRSYDDPWRRRRKAELRVRISLGEAYTGTSVTVAIPSRRPGGPPRSVKIGIPPGARTGDRLRLQDPPTSVVLTVDPGPFVVDGRDVRTRLEVTPWEAALGCTLPVPAPHGVLRLKVPPSTSSGTVLRLRDQGLPVKPDRTGQRGHLYVEIRIRLPSELTTEERRLFEQLAQVSAFDPRAPHTGR
jgi:curved DNA-binding protein